MISDEVYFTTSPLAVRTIRLRALGTKINKALLQHATLIARLCVTLEAYRYVIPRPISM